MFTLWNPTASAQDIAVTFYYPDGSGQYKVPVHLGPQASTMIDMAMLIAEHRPDAEGSIIPPSVQEGSAEFASAKGRNESITLVIAAGIYNVSTATCGGTCTYCCGVSNVGVSPNPILCPIGDSMPCSSTTVDCSGQHVAPSSWSSSNTAVMTVDSSGNVHGIAVGQATISDNFNNVIVYTGQVCEPQSCPGGSPSGSTTGNVPPTVNLSGPGYVPLRTGSSQGPNSTTYTPTVNPAGGTYSWSASNSNVTLTNANQATVTVTAATASSKVGDTALTVTYTYNNESSTSTVNITVVKPSSLANPPTTDSTNPTGHTCSATATSNTCSQSKFTGTGSYSSYVRNRSYKILDQFGNWIAGYSLDIQESYSSPTGQCASDSVVTGPPSTGDTVTDCFYFCSATCQQGGSCSVSASQTITVNGYSVRGESVTWSCSSVTLAP